MSKDTLLQNAIQRKNLANEPNAEAILGHARIDALNLLVASREIEKAGTEVVLVVRYQANRDRLIKNEMHGGHITVHSEEDADVTLLELKNDADFAILAKERSTTADMAEGGKRRLFETLFASRTSP